MILVTTGINGSPFDRLLRVIDGLSIDEEIVVQHGPSAFRPRNATCVSFLSFDELNRLVASASRVVTHAGVGSVLVAFLNSKRPIVVPRLSEYGELVDDHQLQFARQLADTGLADVVEELEELPAYVSAAPLPGRPLRPMMTRLISDLSSYLASVCEKDVASANVSESKWAAEARR